MEPLDKDTEQHQLIAMLNNEGWSHVLKPEIARRVKDLYTLILNPTTKRKEEQPDDFIRGQIAAFRYVLEWPTKRAANLDKLVREIERNGGPTPPGLTNG